MGEVVQDNFLNGAVSLKTLYEPQELLEVIHEIEAHAKRERKIHWGPRTLDIDILLYENQIIIVITSIVGSRSGRLHCCCDSQSESYD